MLKLRRVIGWISGIIHDSVWFERLQGFNLRAWSTFVLVQPKEDALHPDADAWHRKKAEQRTVPNYLAVQ